MNSVQVWFERVSLQLERYVKWLTVLIFVLLVLVQVLLTNERVRVFLSRVDCGEGEPYRLEEQFAPELD